MTTDAEPDTRTLTRATRAVTGTGAKSFLDQRILLEAKRLLAHTDLPVGSCAHRLGFRDTGNFTTFFRRQTGLAPHRMDSQPPPLHGRSFASGAGSSCPMSQAAVWRTTDTGASRSSARDGTAPVQAGRACAAGVPGIRRGRRRRGRGPGP
ncbi:helix-turn-helix domain-containing protein [Streptomyces albofaciens]|uniref:helix-turn-helix domain-containing protein n=1 Tax=Streptomyces albofaciens TaxID=66866 RepID=UPI003CC75896